MDVGTSLMVVFNFGFLHVVHEVASTPDELVDVGNRFLAFQNMAPQTTHLDDVVLIEGTNSELSVAMIVHLEGGKDG